MGFLRSLKFYAKSFVFGLLVVVCALYGVIAGVVLRLIGKGDYAQYTVARIFYCLFSRFMGIKITVKNEHYLRIKPSVVIANHQSALDILVISKLFQPGYTVVAKKGLKYIPFLGWFMLALGTFFLDRAKSEKARKVLASALVALKTQKRSIFMFPEGTRLTTQKLELLPFKKGAFHLAQQAGIPVVPVAVCNYSSVFHSATRTFNRGEIIIEMLEPRPTDGLQTREDILKFSEETREDCLKKIENMGYAPVRGQKAGDDDAQDTASEVSVEIVDGSTPLLSTD
ncbi:1-acylglycerol-3-phosphate O [Metschnikowia bicuspidata]|uniref:1-acyl-sn-glycerol-3-phosphate acyltransferase n=1 Tax=Metschnikowia bicuspidata TaxID=27322 RepID=A0A4P9ZCM9_9ASCO|nr:1-acylglycerol-3-phosphate O [Metschnikowia bicuspidata]